MCLEASACCISLSTVFDAFYGNVYLPDKIPTCMKIWIERENKTLEKSFSGTGASLLKELNLYNEEVVLSKNGEIISEKEELSDSDEIKILSVISGG